jgi:S1-C subfamily serine protease
MEDTLLIDAAERYIKGEMSPEEMTYFEEIRKSNPELDQAVVEHIFFLNELEKFSDSKNFRHQLHETAAKLTDEGLISKSKMEGKTKLVYLWNRYKRTVAVAASIAGLVSILSASIISSLNRDKESNIQPLVKQINEQDAKYRKLEKQIGQIKTATIETDAAAVKQRVESKFQATGFLIDATNNYIVTNAHVLKEARNKLIIENNKGEQFLTQSVYVNTENDLAILKVIDPEFKKLAPLPFSIKKSNADLGEQVFMLGFPKEEIVYGEGYISAQNGYEMDTIYCQLNTSANEGNSGSPVINKQGELVGVISSKESNAQGVVFAIKTSHIFRAIEEVKKQPGNDLIKVNSKPSLKGNDRVTQIKKLQDYVFMIKGN